MGVFDKLREVLSLPGSRRLADAADIDRLLATFMATRGNALSYTAATPLAELDLDSIDMMELGYHLEKGLEILLPDEQLPQLRSVGDLRDLCLELRAMHPLPSTQRAIAKALDSDPYGPEVFEQVSEVLDGIQVCMDPSSDRMRATILGKTNSDIVITPKRGFEVHTAGQGPRRCRHSHPVQLVAEIMRLASLASVTSRYQGPFGPGATGGQPGTEHYTAVSTGYLWVVRKRDRVFIAIREGAPTDGACEPPPLAES